MRLTVPFVAFFIGSVSCNAKLILNNGLPDGGNGMNFTQFRVADEFTLGVNASVASLAFWFNPGNGYPVSAFVGTVTYAFYNNASGQLGSLITSGTVAGLAPVSTGGTLPICNLAPHCPLQEAQFNLVSAVPLVAGTYWLELHEGSSLTDNAGLRIDWATSAEVGTAKQDAIPTQPTTNRNLEAAFQLFDTPVPEPGSLALLSLPLVLGFFAYTRKNHQSRLREPRYARFGVSPSGHE